MESYIRDIQDLSPSDRQAVEALVGHTVGQQGQVFVALLDDLTSDQREQWNALLASVLPFHSNVSRSGATPDELDREIDETIAEVRGGRS